MDNIEKIAIMGQWLDNQVNNGKLVIRTKIKSDLSYENITAKYSGKTLSFDFPAGAMPPFADLLEQIYNEFNKQDIPD